MPRRIRLFVRGGIYHVYNRVTRGESVFDRSIDAQYWVKKVAHEISVHELTVFAWCLMPSHYHLVLRTRTTPLWRPMAIIQAGVARRYNRSNNVKGPFWQDRYKARLVQEQADLENLIAYVHLNPVAAGLVDDPVLYRNCGHREMIGRSSPFLLDSTDALLTFGDNPKESRANYLHRLQLVADLRWDGVRIQKLPWWRGVEDAQLTMPNKTPPPEARTFDEKPLPPENHLRPAAEMVLDFFESRVGLPAGRLSGGSQTRLDSRYRRLFSTLSVCWLGFRVCDIAVLLNKAPGSVSRWIAEGQVLQCADAEFRSTLARLRKEVEALRVDDN